MEKTYNLRNSLIGLLNESANIIENYSKRRETINQNKKLKEKGIAVMEYQLKFDNKDKLKKSLNLKIDHTCTLNNLTPKNTSKLTLYTYF